MIDRIKEIACFKTITDLLWPVRCPFCGKCCREGVCDSCHRKLKELEIREPYCMKCGKPIRYQEQEYCHDCGCAMALTDERKRLSYDRGRGLWLHKPPVSTSIYRFKYHDQRTYAQVYAGCMVQCYGELIRQWKPQALVPIPVHPKRRRERGYNQAEILAFEIGKRMGIPVLTHLVRRVRYTGFQKKLDPEQRKKNLQHAFAPGWAREGWSVRLDRVVVIDDIYTTGATINQVSRVLKSMGVQKVYFLAVSIGQGD